jgi:hypothetical protein
MQQSDRPAGRNSAELDPPPGAPGHKRDDLVTAPTLPVAIIGNGGAAAEAVLAMRASGYKGDIHLFADNDHPPYNPMLGTYLVSGKLPLEGAFPFGYGAAFYESNGVTAHLKNAVAHLDAEGRQLITVSGDTYKYERCLVASGARPSVPPVAGLREALTAAGNEGPRVVFTLQTLDDALGIKAAVERLRVAPGGGTRGDAARGGAGGPPPPPGQVVQVLHHPGIRQFQPLFHLHGQARLIKGPQIGAQMGAGKQENTDLVPLGEGGCGPGYFLGQPAGFGVPGFI